MKLTLLPFEDSVIAPLHLQTIYSSDCQSSQNSSKHIHLINSLNENAPMRYYKREMRGNVLC
jgi:hypothetical protein